MDLEKAVAIASDPQTPEDEKQDINSLVFQDMLHAVDGKQYSYARETVEWLQNEGELLHKAMRLQAFNWQVDPNTRDHMLANGKRPFRERGRQAILQVNEYGVVVGGAHGQSRWVEKSGQYGGFAFLRQAVRGLDPIKTVIMTRQRQVEAFLQPERDSAALGFRFIRRDGDKMTKDDKKEALQLEDFILNSGTEFDPGERRRLGREHLRGFVKKLIWDSLAFDACPIELESDGGGELVGYYNVDGTTVRLCTEQGYDGNDQIQAVQLYNSIPHVAFTYHDLIYELRNPRASLEANGYGLAEPEMVIRVLTAWLESFRYNAMGLSRNAIPRGLLVLFGDFGERELNSFSKRMQDMLEGPENRFRLPILAGSAKQQGQRAGAEYINVDKQFDEAHFTKWMTLLISFIFAVYSMDPAEASMPSWSGSNASPLSGKDTAEKLAHSRDKGLVPLVTGYLAGVFNDWIVRRRSKKLKLEFVGLQEEDQQQKAERIRLSRTVNEVREIDGLEPLQSELLGNAPVNPSLIQVYMMEVQQQQQAEMMQAAEGATQGPDINANYDYGQQGQQDEGQPGGEKQDVREIEMAGGAPGGQPPMAKAQRNSGFMVVIEHGADKPAEVAG